MPTRLTPFHRIPRLPKRAADAHKGAFGRVLIVGGSRGMVGAPALAARAALRGGCGLAKIAVPEPIQLTVAGLCPCATTLPLPATRDGRIDARAAATLLLREAKDWADVIALGPGMDAYPGGARLVGELLRHAAVPMVLDADGLNNACAVPAALLAAARAPRVLTPHAGEMQRLLGALKLRFDTRTQRREAARAVAERAGAVVVLKGAGTIVTDGRRLYVNRSGNPGMATGGSGDVLTGLIAALIGQGLAAFEAAVLGVWTHGRAGDLAAEDFGQVSLIAEDLVSYLPAAFQERP